MAGSLRFDGAAERDRFVAAGFAWVTYDTGYHWVRVNRDGTVTIVSDGEIGVPADGDRATVNTYPFAPALFDGDGDVPAPIPGPLDGEYPSAAAALAALTCPTPRVRTRP